VFSERKPAPRPKSRSKVIRDSNPDFQINANFDSDVCRIARRVLWIKYLVGISHFAECRENRLVTMRNADKSPKIDNPQWGEKLKSDPERPESVSWISPQ